MVQVTPLHWQLAPCRLGDRDPGPAGGWTSSMTMTVTVTVGVLRLSHCQVEFRACNTTVTESESKVTMLVAT